MATEKPTLVKQVEGAEVATEVLATAIVSISEAMKRIQNGRLNQRALLVLIRDNCSPQVSLTDIKNVLNSLESLSAAYTKPAPKK